MAYHSTTLDSLFQALSDPTRRAILARLSDGPLAVGVLAEPFVMALPSFMAHLNKLESSGLIETHKTGRVRYCALRPAALQPARTWMDDQRALWTARLDNLEAYLETLTKDPNP